MLTCLLPTVPTGGPASLVVTMDGGATYSAAVAGSSFVYYPLVSFAVRHPPPSRLGSQKLFLVPKKCYV